MTKEKLFNKEWWNYQEKDGSKLILQSSVFERLHKFFESNVCIPKGVNRHPYADVLHAYAEGIKCEMKGNDSNTWLALLFSDFFEYRIKPSEPVKKYRYAYLDYDGTPSISEHMTEGYASTHIVNRTKATRLDWSVIDE